MTFNHYAKIKIILATQPPGWYIKLINKPTTAKNFKGETIYFDHYYRIYDANDQQIKYCKFQQIDRLSKALDKSTEELNILD